MTNITIIDYGSGNLRSVCKAFEHVLNNLVIPAQAGILRSPTKSGMTVTLTSNAADVKNATHIVLPGVGAFADCAAGLAAIPNMIDALKEHALQNKKPFLGICVGMQLLADFGHEYGTHKGLGWINGEVKRIETSLPIPHMGWNNLQIKKPHPLVRNIESDVYFVHSYAFHAANAADVVATTTYGQEITAIIAKDNIMGVQFHPEKSQQAGLQLIKNFIEM